LLVLCSYYSATFVAVFINVEIEYVRKFDFNSLSIQEKKIVLYLEEYTSIVRKDVETILNTSKRTAIRLLNELIEKEIVTTTGNTNNLEYILK